MTWPDFPTKQRSKRWRWAPVWHVAVRSNRLLRTERAVSAKLRADLRLAGARLAAERVMRHEAEAERDRARALVVALEAGVDWDKWERSLREGER